MRRRSVLQGLAALASGNAWPGFASGAGRAVDGTGLKPVGLRCEYAVNPLGVEASAPRLSWRLESTARAQAQSAYQILVATSAEKLADGVADLWDSGRIPSTESVHIAYRGQSLRSFERCYWKVKIWDQRGTASAYSEAARWEMGILEAREWQAQWIGAAEPGGESSGQAAGDGDDRAPLFRKTFHLRELPQRARACICGLGYYELYLNGAKVGDHVLDAAQTDYAERAFYAVYDITGALERGANAAGVMLGSGWFNQDEVWKTGKYAVPGGTNYGEPRFLAHFRFEYADGSVETIGSDQSWKTAAGPIVRNNVYAGEVYDTRLEIPGWCGASFDNGAWKPARRREGPARRLEAQSLPPIRRVRTLPAVGLAEPQPGVFVYDFGQNFAGWARLKMTAPRGTEIVLRFAETLGSDGMIDPASTGVFATGVVQTDKYLARGGDEETWEPRFTYHGFRYAEMTGFPGRPALANLEGMVVHSDLAPAGEFECSDAMLNRIHHTALWTETSNLHGVPTDCPARERCGWLGDAQVTAEMTIYNFDMARFWAKFAADIETSEGQGLPTMVAPGKRSGGAATPDWGTAIVQIPWYLYLYYGDRRALEEHYPSMKRWAGHLQSLARDGIVEEGLGDWCPPGSVAPTETPVALTSTGYYYLDLKIMSEAAGVLGRDEDRAQYGERARQVKHAFNGKFFDAAGASYGSQTADAWALYLGLVPQGLESAVAASLARDVVEKHHGHFSTGITGSRWLYWALAEYGQGETALGILRQRTYPSIGDLFARGATTFWETWGEADLDRQYGPRSLNHAMQGGFDAWFYQGLGGIWPDPRAPGFKHIVLRPQLLPGLSRVRVVYDSAYGKIASAWKLDGGGFSWRLVIPANTTATVYLPQADASTLRESGKPLRQVPELSPRGEEGGRTVLEVGSGEYVFEGRVKG